MDNSEEQKEKDDIDISIENAINYHNNKNLSSSGYRPDDLRNISD